MSLAIYSSEGLILENVTGPPVGPSAGLRGEQAPGMEQDVDQAMDRLIDQNVDD